MFLCVAVLNLNPFDMPVCDRNLIGCRRIIWLGDLNYRINLPYEQTRELISKRDWSKLVERDQVRFQFTRFLPNLVKILKADPYSVLPFFFFTCLSCAWLVDPLLFWRGTLFPLEKSSKSFYSFEFTSLSPYWGKCLKDNHFNIFNSDLQPVNRNKSNHYNLLFFWLQCSFMGKYVSLMHYIGFCSLQKSSEKAVHLMDGPKVPWALLQHTNMRSTQILTVERIRRLGGEHHHGMHHALQKLPLYTLWFSCVTFTWSSKLSMSTFFIHFSKFMDLCYYVRIKFFDDLLSIRALMSILAISVQP